MTSSPVGGGYRSYHIIKEVNFITLSFARGYLAVLDLSVYKFETRYNDEVNF